MMGRNWVQDNREAARQRGLDLMYERAVRQEMERRVAVWLATRHLTRGEALTLSPSQLSDEQPSTSSCDETFPPAA